MENGPEVFAGKRDEDRQAVESERDELYRKVGHQQVQIDFLEKYSRALLVRSRSLVIGRGIWPSSQVRSPAPPSGASVAQGPHPGIAPPLRIVQFLSLTSTR